MANPRSKARKAHPRAHSAAQAKTKTEQSHPEISMKKPAKTALPPSPTRTSGQVTSADKPPAPRQDTDKNRRPAPQYAGPGRRPHDQPGRDRERRPEFAEGQRARADAARRLPAAREDHAFRPRAHSRARRPCPRRGGAWLSSRSTRTWPTSPWRRSCRTRRVQTPVFVRFSTVAGSRGSTDTPRDVRGFAVKFYTDEGVWDLVGNNMPVFFIQDADQVSRPHPRGEARAAQRDPAGAVGARHVLGLRLADAGKRPHADVGDERPRASRAASR